MSTGSRRSPISPWLTGSAGPDPEAGVAAPEFPALVVVGMGAYEYQPDDMDADGDVDLLDFAGFQLCFTGPDSGSVDPTCEGFDADCDHHVDLADFAAFQRSFTRR
ncbi:MAG: hypothetical protein JSU86_00745 [Phycisphaerales bacterium]|nr:MAG: hypothetical protein JSU86_00745 [Phycisphaerales bacterium]